MFNTSFTASPSPIGKSQGSPLFDTEADLPVLTEIISVTEHIRPSHHNPSVSKPHPSLSKIDERKNVFQGLFESPTEEKIHHSSNAPPLPKQESPPSPKQKTQRISEEQARQIVEKLLHKRATPLQNKLLDQLSKELPVIITKQLHKIIHQTVSEFSKETIKALLSTSSHKPQDVIPKDPKPMYSPSRKTPPFSLPEPRIAEPDFSEETTRFIARPDSEDSDSHKTEAVDIVGAKTIPFKSYDESKNQQESLHQKTKDALLSI